MPYPNGQALQSISNNEQCGLGLCGQAYLQTQLTLPSLPTHVFKMQSNILKNRFFSITFNPSKVLRFPEVHLISHKSAQSHITRYQIYTQVSASLCYKQQKTKSTDFVTHKEGLYCSILTEVMGPCEECEGRKEKEELRPWPAGGHQPLPACRCCPMHPFPVAAITNYCKCRGLKQHNRLSSQF